METQTTSTMSQEEIVTAVQQLVEKGSFTKKYDGVDNYKKPKSVFLTKIVQSSDEKLYDMCKEYIWLSAYASNNPRSDYHWMCDACYDEAQRRGKGEIYSKAHAYTSANA